MLSTSLVTSSLREAACRNTIRSTAGLKKFIHSSPSKLNLLRTNAIISTSISNLSTSSGLRGNSGTMDVPPPPSLGTPIQNIVPWKQLMGPGPTNIHERVLLAGSLPLVGHLHKEFTQIMDEVKEGIQYAFQTDNPCSLAVSGTGHAAMETMMTNVLERGDVLLVAMQGIWGERASALAERQGAKVAQIVKKPGEVFSLAELDAALTEHKPAAFFVAHSESSSGFMQPLEGIGELCRKHNCLFLVDTVASLGSTPFYADRLGCDVVYTGSQKALGCPPGVCPITFNKRALSKVRSRATPPAPHSYYFDICELANYWAVPGYGEARKYHHTAPISTVYQLREALSMLAEEGLPASWERHTAASRQLQQGVEAMGLRMFVENPEHRLPGINAIRVPDGVDWKRVVDRCMSESRLEISGGLGPTAGKIWRVGVLGVNANPVRIQRTLDALADALKQENWKA